MPPTSTDSVSSKLNAYCQWLGLHPFIRQALDAIPEDAREHNVALHPSLRTALEKEKKKTTSRKGSFPQPSCWTKITEASGAWRLCENALIGCQSRDVQWKQLNMGRCPLQPKCTKL